jgi:hypothetical protein
VLPIEVYAFLGPLEHPEGGDGGHGGGGGLRDVVEYVAGGSAAGELERILGHVAGVVGGTQS